MPSNYDSIDLTWTHAGDLTLDDKGDLGSTENDQIATLVQDVQDIVKSEPGDWELYPGRGAGTDDFIGLPNTKGIGDQLHDRLKNAIVLSARVGEDDLKVRVIPTGPAEVLCIVRIAAVPTEKNSISDQSGVVIQFVFNYAEKGVSAIPVSNGGS